MATKSKQSIIKTPIELQLEKLSLMNISQQRNIEIEYSLLNLLNQITLNNPEIVNTPIFMTIFNEIIGSEEFETIKMLPLFELFSYRLWNNEAFNYELREKTSFYKIVSNWIISFELKSGNLSGILNKFDLISNFMAKQTTTVLERIVMMEEILEDLKEFIDQQFWQNPKDITIVESPKKKEGQKEPVINEHSLNCIQKILQVVSAIINPVFYRVHPKELIYKNCTYGSLIFKNTNQFIKKSIFYMLKHPNTPSHIQTEISKIALIYLQSISVDDSGQIVKMLKYMMVNTSKAVRFALIIEYVEFYEYLEMMGFESVIQQLENMIYFRELIIGKKMVEQNIKEIGNTMNDLNLSYQEVYIKAGTSKKIYFSNYSEENILKLDLFLEENDINIKITYFNNLKIQKSRGKNVNKLIFNAVSQLNQYDASKLQGEKCYWKQEKSTSKKLQLKLQYEGLYCIQLDNSYSWVIPKNARYRLQIYQPFRR